MADEATDALIPEAPSTEDAALTEAPAPTPADVVERERYENLRREFDRKNALLDRATKGDVEAIRALGFEYDEPDADPTPVEDYEDPYAPKLTAHDKELAELKAWKQQVEAEKVANSIRSHVDSLSTEHGVELTDRDKEIIFSQAVGGDQISADQTEAAFKAHVEWRNALLESVQAKPAPPRPGTGQAATKQPDLDNPQERHAWMMARLNGDA